MEKIKQFENSEYEELIGALVGDIFYEGAISNTTKIAIIRRYSKIILRKIFNIPETERMTIGGSRIKEAVKEKNNSFLSNAIDVLHTYGDENTHTEKTTLPTDDELSSVINALYDLLAYLFIDYFEKYRFGTDSNVMAVFSILPPDLRLKILSHLYENDKNNISIIDKYVLAILKSNSEEAALKWIDERKESLETLSVATKENDERTILQYGEELAELFFSKRPKNMYELCYNKVINVAEQIKKNGPLYKTFEEAKQLYVTKGILPEIKNEYIEFYSIMNFCYLGRKVIKKEYNINNYIVSEVRF